MLPFSSGDQRHLEAAQSWCGLNAYLDANEELDQITAQARSHPTFLEVRWQVYANLGKWEGALEIANALTKRSPNCPEGWIYRGISLGELNRPEDAYATLMDAVNTFPTNEIIHYDLACICCELKRTKEAQFWLGKAIDLGGDDTRLRALDDNDLEPIWETL